MMDAPEIFSDRKTFALLAGIAALGLSLAFGINFAVAKLAPSPAPLPKASIFDPDLRGAVANYPDAVKETRAVFTAATPQGTKTVTNCADYLKLLDQGVRSMVVDPTDAHNAPDLWSSLRAFLARSPAVGRRYSPPGHPK